MHDTAQPYTPAGACHGSCNHRQRTTWTAHQQALNTHADQIDTWYRNGQKGDPPAEPPTPEIRWTPGNPLFCDRDIAATRRALLELDVQAAQLDANSDGHRSRARSDAPVTGSRGTPSVSPLAELHDTFLGDLFRWEDTWRALRGYPPRPSSPRGPRGAHARTRTIGWLAEHLADMLAHPDMVDVPARVYRWEKVLRHVNRDDRASTTSPIRCPRPTCQERRIIWDDERHYYVCRACGNILYADEHDQREREQAEAVELARLAAGPRPPAVEHRPLVPAAGDDVGSRRA